MNTKESLKVEVTIQNHDSLLKDFSLLKEENAGLVKLKMAVKDLQDIVKKKDLELVRIAKINDDLKNSEKELKSKIESNEDALKRKDLELVQELKLRTEATKVKDAEIDALKQHSNLMEASIRTKESEIDGLKQSLELWESCIKSNISETNNLKQRLEAAESAVSFKDSTIATLIKSGQTLAAEKKVAEENLSNMEREIVEKKVLANQVKCLSFMIILTFQSYTIFK